MLIVLAQDQLVQYVVLKEQLTLQHEHQLLAEVEDLQQLRELVEVEVLLLRHVQIQANNL